MSAVMFIFIAATQLNRSAKQEDFAMENGLLFIGACFAHQTHKSPLKRAYIKSYFSCHLFDLEKQTKYFNFLYIPTNRIGDTGYRIVFGENSSNFSSG